MLKIRLRRMGNRHRPFYRVVVSDGRKVPTSSALEEIGYYDPRNTPSILNLDLERAEHWLAKGAQASSTVHKLIRRARNVDPEAEAKAAEEAAAKRAAEKAEKIAAAKAAAEKEEAEKEATEKAEAADGEAEEAKADDAEASSDEASTEEASTEEAASDDAGDAEADKES